MTDDALLREHVDAGFRMLRMAGAWRTWVNRRVESISLVNETTIRRRISVDLTIPPGVITEGMTVVNVPIALLAKQLLLNFDVRDEASESVPLLTRRETSSIAAAMLEALGRSVAAREAFESEGLDQQQASELITQLVVPDELRQWFYDIAYLPPLPELAYDDHARDRLETFGKGVEPPAGPVTAWATDPGVTTEQWRGFLAGQPARFGYLLSDLAENFLVVVPLMVERGPQRILKLAYDTPIATPAGGRGLRSRYASFGWRVSDVFEGVRPVDGWDWEAAERHWAARRDMPVDPLSDPGTEGRRPLSETLGAWLGWGTYPLRLFVPGIAQAQSYHFELEAPEGLQVRSATLTLAPAGGAEDEAPETADVRRGARTLVRAHLQASLRDDVAVAPQATVTVLLKAEATKLLRGATIAAGIAALLLGWYYVVLDTVVAERHDDLGSIAAVLLLLPSLITGLVVGGAEHPMTTYVLFRQRVIAVLVAVWPAAGAILLVTVPDRHWLDDAWLILVVLAVATLGALAFGWLLAERRRPDGEAP